MKKRRNEEVKHACRMVIKQVTKERRMTGGRHVEKS